MKTPTINTAENAITVLGNFFFSVINKFYANVRSAHFTGFLK